MLAILLAAALAATPAQDTVVLTDGTKLSGVVVEEGPAGVTLQMEDGTLRRFELRQVSRIELADGSVTTWSQAPDAPAATGPGAKGEPPPAPASPEPPPRGDGSGASPPPRGDGPGAAPSPLDTVFLVTGGRVRGRVLEELPTTGVLIEIPGGGLRRFRPDQVARIEYADGSVSSGRDGRPRPPPPPPRGPYAAPPPRRPPPPRPPPPPYAERPRPVPPRNPPPLFFAFGLGGASVGGDLEREVDADDLFDGQLQLWLEGGGRLTPAIALALYLDLGVGDPASPVRTECDLQAVDCLATTARLGLLLRHTWDPAEPLSKWVAVGTGVTAATISSDASGNPELISYTGLEHVRLMAGLDFRTSAVFGFGLYGGLSWGTFYRVEENEGGSQRIPERRMHTVGELGLRLILFP